MIYIIRHGETEKNRAMLLQGRSDQPRNDAGIRQAERVRDFFLARGIRFDRVCSSPLIRAVQTAQIVAPGTEVLTDARLLEMDYGPYEGASLKNPAPELLHFFMDLVHHPAPAGMESLASVVQRLGAFLEDIHGNGNLLISTHAIAMKGALEFLTPDSGGAYWAKHIGNCAVYTAEQTDTGYTVPTELKI